MCTICINKHKLFLLTFIIFARIVSAAFFDSQQFLSYYSNVSDSKTKYTVICHIFLQMTADPGGMYY